MALMQICQSVPSQENVMVSAYLSGVESGTSILKKLVEQDIVKWPKRIWVLSEFPLFSANSFKF